MTFKFRHLFNLGGTMRLSLPLDQQGFMGRECPQSECEGYFKVKPGTGLSGPDLQCVCPYCGHQDPPNRFFTKAQNDYIESVALRTVEEAITKDLKSAEFEMKPQGIFGIGISMKVKSGPLRPIRYYREQELETHVTCASCTLDYAVYGLFAYCPDCRVHNSLQILQDNLKLTRKQLLWAETLEDDELQRHVTEDALENCVSAFDAFAREACRIRAIASTDPAKCTSLSFQNLSRASALLARLFGVDLSAAVPPAAWTAAQTAFMKRHLLAHKAGVIDQQYLDQTGESPALLRRRLRISAGDVALLVDTILALGEHLIKTLPPP
jgi:hypothetical protein